MVPWNQRPSVCIYARLRASIWRTLPSFQLIFNFLAHISSSARVAEQLLKLGCYEVSLGDTIGIGTPGRCKE